MISLYRITLLRNLYHLIRTSPLTLNILLNISYKSIFRGLNFRFLLIHFMASELGINLRPFYNINFTYIVLSHLHLMNIPAGHCLWTVVNKTCCIFLLTKKICSTLRASIKYYFNTRNDTFNCNHFIIKNF